MEAARQEAADTAAPATVQPERSSAAPAWETVLALQRSAGNRATTRWLNRQAERALLQREGNGDEKRPAVPPPSGVYESLVQAISANRLFEPMFGQHLRPSELAERMREAEEMFALSIDIPDEDAARFAAIADESERAAAERAYREGVFAKNAGKSLSRFVEDQFLEGITACGESSWNLSQLFLGLDYAENPRDTKFANLKTFFTDAAAGRLADRISDLEFVHGKSIPALLAALERTTEPQFVRIMLIGKPYGHGYVLEQFWRPSKHAPIRGRIYQSNIGAALSEGFSLGDWLRDEKGKRPIYLRTHVTELKRLIEARSGTAQRRAYADLFMLTGTSLPADDDPRDPPVRVTFDFVAAPFDPQQAAASITANLGGNA